MLVGEENEAFFIRVWKPLHSKCFLKTLKGSPKGKTQSGQYLLARLEPLQFCRILSWIEGWSAVTS